MHAKEVIIIVIIAIGDSIRKSPILSRSVFIILVSEIIDTNIIKRTIEIS